MFVTMWRNWVSHTLLVRMENGMAILINSWQFFKKLNMQLPYNPEIAHFCIFILEKRKFILTQKACTLMLIEALFVITQNCKKHKCSSVAEWLNRLWYIYMVEYLVSWKKEQTTVMGINPDGSQGLYVD